MYVSYTSGLKFCLDNDPLRVSRTSWYYKGLKVTLSVDLYLYDLVAHKRKYTYELPYFKGTVKIYPGEYIQKLFEEVTNWDDLRIDDSGSLNIKRFFKAARVKISLTEYTIHNALSRSDKTISGLYFLPGRKPKAFPYLTNAKSRTSYANSLIILSALGKDIKALKLGRLSGANIDTISINEGYSIYGITFRRSFSDKFFGASKVVKDDYLSIDPIPSPRSIIDVVFLNQNMCPEWLHFSEEWKLQSELKHLIADDVQEGLERKIKTNEKQILELNTGWLFDDEVILINELLRSKYCFVKLEGEWIRCIPISTKPLPQDTERKLNSQIIKFQISKEK